MLKPVLLRAFATRILSYGLNTMDDFTFLPPSLPAAFSIFNEPTLADQVVESIDGGKQINLVLTADTTLGRQSKMNLSLDAADDVPVKVQIITSLQIVYDLLSSYCTNALEYNRKKKLQQTGVQLLITKIGQTSGDIHLQIEGQASLLIDILILFISKNVSNSSHYSVSVLVSREVLLDPPTDRNNIKFHCSKDSYCLAPGCLLVISSQSVELISLWIIQLSAVDPATSSCVKLLTFRKPPSVEYLDFTSAVDYAQLGDSQDPSPVTNVRAKGDESTFKLVELTRKEVTYLIGKKGRRIEDIRKHTNAVVKVIPLSKSDQTLYYNPLATQFLRLSGKRTEIHKAMKMIEADIYQFRANGISSYY